MEYTALRRAHAVVENGGFLAVPAAYFTVALASPNARDPDLAFFTLAYVFVLVWSRRQSAASAAGARPNQGRGKNRWPRALVEAADRGVLRQSAVRAAFDLLGFLVLLMTLQTAILVQARGEDATLLYAEGIALTVAVLGMAAWFSRNSLWRRFAREHPGIWGAPDGLNQGRTVRSPAPYFAWREAAQLEP